MTWKEFFDKYHLLNKDQVDPSDIAGFLGVMDYLYCTCTKEQVINFIAEFYDNADDIYNSIVEDVGEMLNRIGNMAQELGIQMTDEDNDIPTEKIKYDA